MSRGHDSLLPGIELPSPSKRVPIEEERLPPDILLATLLDDLAKRLAHLEDLSSHIETALNTVADLVRPPVTKQEVLRDISVDAPYRVAKLQGAGYLDELILVTASKDWRISYSWDDVLREQRTYDEFATYSSEWVHIGAWQKYDWQGNPGDYVFRMSQVGFRHKLEVILIPSSSLVVKELICKYTAR